MLVMRSLYCKEGIGQDLALGSDILVEVGNVLGRITTPMFWYM